METYPRLVKIETPVVVMKMRVLDLFSGLGGFSAAFADRGHEVVTLDWSASFGPTLEMDVMNNEVFDILKEHGPFAIVLASPDCTPFSVMNISKHWTPPPEHAPKTEKAIQGVALVQRTRDIIEHLSPRYFIIENPRAKLRKLPVMEGLERRTVTYCAYGDNRMKPTDLWGGFPPTLILRPMCKNGDPCHEAAPRGSKTGTQGIKSSADRALIPYELSLDICIATEQVLEEPC